MALETDSHFWTIGGLEASICLIIMAPLVCFKLAEIGLAAISLTFTGAAWTGLTATGAGALTIVVGFGAETAALTGLTGAEIA